MKKILIIEDSATVTKLLKHLLSKNPDIQAYFADSFAASKALYAQHQDEIFAAIVDLNLPDAPNGETVDYFLSKGLPAIVLTANYNEEKREQLLNKGIVDYIIKESRYSYNYALSLVRRLHKNQAIKILVAEDSKPSRAFIKALLEQHLYQVLEASDGKEALEVLQDHPDIKMLITDYHMPEMDGFALVKAIRHNTDRSNLVIIGLSAESKGSLTARFIKNGANDFLHKPFNHEEFYCRVNHNIEELEMLEAIKDAAFRDHLSQLHNRHHLFTAGAKLHQQALDHATPLACAILDIDHFKAINDQYGHEGGDQVIRYFADELKLAFGRFLIARLGGEEFCVLMPGLNNEQAVTLVETFQDLLHQHSVPLQDDELHFSFSAGVSNIKCDSLDEHINEADQLLYRAKQAGRNIVIGDD